MEHTASALDGEKCRPCLANLDLMVNLDFTVNLDLTVNLDITVNLDFTVSLDLTISVTLLCSGLWEELDESWGVFTISQVNLTADLLSPLSSVYVCKVKFSFFSHGGP